MKIHCDDFSFYRTFYDVESDDPVAVGYEAANLATIEKLNRYPGRQFVHSGNWWSIPPKSRTPEVVLEAEEALVNNRTDSMMSINWPPGIEKPSFSKQSYIIWKFTSRERGRL